MCLLLTHLHVQPSAAGPFPPSSSLASCAPRGPGARGRGSPWSHFPPSSSLAACAPCGPGARGRGSPWSPAPVGAASSPPPSSWPQPLAFLFPTGSPPPPSSSSTLPSPPSSWPLHAFGTACTASAEGSLWTTEIQVPNNRNSNSCRRQDTPAPTDATWHYSME